MKTEETINKRWSWFHDFLEGFGWTDNWSGESWLNWEIRAIGMEPNQFMDLPAEEFKDAVERIRCDRKRREEERQEQEQNKKPFTWNKVSIPMVNRTISGLAPIDREFVQFLGEEGYEPEGMRAKDDQSVEYCAVSSGIWEGWLVFRKAGEPWQAGRLLTEDDEQRIASSNSTLSYKKFPMIKRVFPELLVKDIVGVQPMTEETSSELKFKMRFMKKETKLMTGDDIKPDGRFIGEAVGKLTDGIFTFFAGVKAGTIYVGTKWDDSLDMFVLLGVSQYFKGDEFGTPHIARGPQVFPIKFDDELKTSEIRLEKEVEVPKEEILDDLNKESRPIPKQMLTGV